MPRDLYPATGGAAAPGGPGPRAGQAPRRALKNWRVRSRLFLLVIIPTLTAVAAGGLFIASSVQSALVNQRTLTLANLSDRVTNLVQALQTEREDTVRFIGLGNTAGGRFAPAISVTDPKTGITTPGSGPELAKLNQDYAASNGWATQVQNLAGGVGGAYSALAQQDAKAAVTAIGDLTSIRDAATGTHIPAAIVIAKYASAIGSLLSVESQIAVGSSDSTLAGGVRVLGLVSSMKEDASQQQALLTSALNPDQFSLRPDFGSTQLQAITNEQAQQQGSLAEFNTAATSDQVQSLNGALSGTQVQQTLQQVSQAVSLASSSSQSTASSSIIATDPTMSDASSNLNYVVGSLRSVEQQFADSVVSRASSLHGSAITEVILFSIAVIVLLAIALALTLLVGRSMVGPLRRLRNGALEVAEIRLPETVSRMSEADAASIALNIEPIDVDSLDEIGEVARAFDQVHTEAVRLAANEAALRGNVNAMFVNLSRRIQSLVERQIRVITKLEQTEQDSERLANLFQVDHLATRMRRNSENLLVLAGQEFARRWGQPVSLVDVIRAAVSEIEQYERVTTNVEPGISIRRDAVRDVVHLVAELVENATSFSATETPVTIEAYPLDSGGVLIDIADQGVGMRPEAMSQANHRLDNPPAVDVEVSRRMGLFVVAQLAARHGIRVRLRQAASAGLSALVWLPPEAITQQQAGHTGSQQPAGQAMSALETSNGNGSGRPSIMSGPQPVAEQLGMADMGTIRRRMRAGGLAGPSPSAAEPEPERWGAHRTETPSVASGTGQYPVQNGNSVNWAEPARPQIQVPSASPVVPPVPMAPAPVAPAPVAPAPVTRAPVMPTAPAPAAQVASTPASAAPADGRARRERLPIYEAVETVWFRGGRQVMSDAGQEREADWTTPADDGWRAAEVANAPTSDGITQSGLPKRAPGTNLVPGTAPASSASSASMPLPASSRSAAENRNRFASYQRGLQRARSAAVGADSKNEGDMAS